MSFVHTERLHPAESVAHAHHTHSHHTAERSAAEAVVCRHCNHFLYPVVLQWCKYSGFFEFYALCVPFFLKNPFLRPEFYMPILSRQAVLESAVNAFIVVNSTSSGQLSRDTEVHMPTCKPTRFAVVSGPNRRGYAKRHSATVRCGVPESYKYELSFAVDAFDTLPGRRSAQDRPAK